MKIITAFKNKILQIFGISKNPILGIDFSVPESDRTEVLEFEFDGMQLGTFTNPKIYVEFDPLESIKEMQQKKNIKVECDLYHNNPDGTQEKEIADYETNVIEEE